MNKQTIQEIASNLVTAEGLNEEGNIQESFDHLRIAVNVLFDAMLLEQYRSEFEYYQREGHIHRDGLTFEEWAHKMGYLLYTETRPGRSGKGST